MTPAFWDTSGVLPLCLQQQASTTCNQLHKQYSLVVWWGTSVELWSAFERLLRTSHITSREYASGTLRLAKVRGTWQEIRPTKAIRTTAEQLLASHTLKASDALQLAAAWTWSEGQPQQYVFIAGDAQLLRAAQQLGFQTIEAR